MLVRSGRAPRSASATPVIIAKADRCDKVVNTKGLARRAANPPVKSEAPHINTAATEYTAGPNWSAPGTLDESSTCLKSRRSIARIRSTLNSWLDFERRKANLGGNASSWLATESAGLGPCAFETFPKPQIANH